MVRTTPMKLTAMIGALTLGLSASVAAAADDFFANKTITILIASSPGGGLDTFGRLVARHLSKHIPGNPTIMPQNLPGAGGAIVAGQLYNIAPKDGTVMGIPFASVILDPLLVTGRKEYDPRKFNYVGNAQSEVLVCFLRKDAPVKTLADLKSKELILGSSAPGSPSYDLPIVAKNVLGLNIKMVTGYKGSREVTLAMESGELHGTCGLSWTTLKVQYPTIVKNEAFGYVFAQEDLVGLPKLNKEGVPLMMQLATEEKQRQALAMIYAQNGFARPFILPPGVPADRVALLRKAFDETMRDPETVADAERMNIDLNPATGDFVQQAVAKMYETPPEVIETVKKALGRTGG